MDGRSCIKADIKIDGRVIIFVVDVDVVIIGWFVMFVSATFMFVGTVKGCSSRFYEYLKIVNRLLNPSDAGERVQTLVCYMLL